MTVLPIVDLLILMGTGSLGVGFVLKGVALTTTYNPTFLGFSSIDMLLIALTCFGFALVLAARTWLRLNEPHIQALERRIGDRPSGPSSEADTPAPPPRREGDDETPMFPWLEPGSLGVFVPVLLGVGAILSAFAYAVERIAAAMANGDRSDPRLATIALPPGSLRDAPPEATNPTADRSNARRAVVTGALAVAAITGSVVALANGAMYREGPDPVSGTTTVLLRVETRSGPANASAVANTLWMTCRGDVDDDVSLVGVEAVAPNVASLMVAPRIAAHDERRFLGCLEDLRFDRVRIEITSWAEVHPPSPGPDSGSVMPVTTETSIVGVAASNEPDRRASGVSSVTR